MGLPDGTCFFNEPEQKKEPEMSDDIKLAMTDSYALMLKHQKSTEPDRLIIVKMSSAGSFEALMKPAVKAFWFFDPSQRETLVMACADAITLGSRWSDVRKVFDRFSFSTETIERISREVIIRNGYLIYKGKKEGRDLYMTRYVDAYGREYLGEGEEDVFGLLVDIRYEAIEKRMILVNYKKVEQLDFYPEPIEYAPLGQSVPAIPQDEEEVECEHDWSEIIVGSPQGGQGVRNWCRKCSMFADEEPEDNVHIEVDIEDLKSDVERQVG